MVNHVGAALSKELRKHKGLTLEAYEAKLIEMEKTFPNARKLIADHERTELAALERAVGEKANV